MRVKTGYQRKRKHKKVLSLTKGYRMTKNRLYKKAKEALLHAGQYAFIGRRLRRRDLRKLWIQRINAALANYDLKYSKFIPLMGKAKIKINRKILAHLAATDINGFKAVVDKAKSAS